MRRCLYCYEELDKENIPEFHARCSKKFFGTSVPPELPLEDKDLELLATKIINARITIPGVQPKLSLNLERDKNDPKKSRLTIAGLWGNFILKPPPKSYPSLPENEDLTMKLAGLAGIKTAEHSLIRTTSGSLAYITKRFDRVVPNNGLTYKIPMEDLCQLSELPSSGNSKYNSSMEKTGKLIRGYSSVPGLDAIHFLEMALFGFITGNADMHLKNFSMIRDLENQYRLSPAYDMVSTVLALPDDTEQMALTLNAKRNKIRRNDFFEFAARLGINDGIVAKTIIRLHSIRNEWERMIRMSFLPVELQKKYMALTVTRMKILEGKK
jgi:serine/threonine-protein kinase HipA